jgi:hypothetical protein
MSKIMHAPRENEVPCENDLKLMDAAGMPTRMGIVQYCCSRAARLCELASLHST